MQVLCYHCQKFFTAKDQTFKVIRAGKATTRSYVDGGSSNSCSKKCRADAKAASFALDTLKKKHQLWYANNRLRERQFSEMLGIS